MSVSEQSVTSPPWYCHDLPADRHTRCTRRPILEAALSAPAALERSPYLSLPDAFLTRQEYLEGGLSASRRKFKRAYWDDEELAQELGLETGTDNVQLS